MHPEERTASSLGTPNPADRRAERRFKGRGPLKLIFADPSRQEVLGRLVDYSKSGFRAIHACVALHSGQVVEFQHPVAVGKARVMWNRISGDSVETGFLVIP
jgi:hypothetical protein